MNSNPENGLPVPRGSWSRSLLVCLLGLIGIVAPLGWAWSWYTPDPKQPDSQPERRVRTLALQPRTVQMDSSGYGMIVFYAAKWDSQASLAEIRDMWLSTPEQLLAGLKHSQPFGTGEQIRHLLTVSGAHSFQGQTQEAYDAVLAARQLVESDDSLAAGGLASMMYLQGVLSLRLGEDQNCVLCRGESSCILPISSAAVHKFPEGSRLAIQHLTEFLTEFPDDLEAKWLLNIAYMTLGEYPQKVEPRFLISLEKYLHPGADIGKFRDIGHLVGVNRFNQAGGVIMDDLDNDGLLDLFTTSFDPTLRAAVYQNQGDGQFKELGESAGLLEQFGGLVCVQTDYNNDGLLDVYIPRGAWLPARIRPSLLRNDGGMKFTDVTDEVGLLDPVNSNAAAWSDYDNDGWLDLFVCCEKQGHRLYHNKGDGTFEERSHEAGLRNRTVQFGKGCNWIDYDNDNYPDLFINNLSGPALLFHNERDGTFSDVTQKMGITGPDGGFSCWAWDYDNDGWLDIFATCYERTLQDVVHGIIGEPATLPTSKLFRNLQGKGFEDVSEAAGVNQVFAAMGSNFGDFDNDGYLDFYLGTGEPNLATLIPNRMFLNRQGKSFVDITGPAGVGHLQKGHAIASGDWDRDGNLDIFAQMGGATNGDRYHNILFQNPGHSHPWITLKLVGTRTNRAALGARIKITTAGDKPQTIHRHVTSGSSFGGNPLLQTIGLGAADKVAELEVHWPTSNTTQVFRDLDLRTAWIVTEDNPELTRMEWNRVPVPAAEAPQHAPQ